MQRINRWFPLWAAVVMASVWVVFCGIGLSSYLLTSPIDRHGTLAMVIMTALLALLVLLFFQRTHALVTPQGVLLRHGPLPYTKRSVRIPRMEIVRCFYHHVHRIAKGGGPYWMAGVVTADGRYVEVLFEYPDEQSVQAACAYLAEALGGSLTCEKAAKIPYERPAGAATRLLAWMAIVVTSLLASGYLEASR